MEKSVTTTPILSDATIARQTLAKIHRFLKTENYTKLQKTIESLHYADIADVLEVVSLEYRLEILKFIPRDIEAEVFLDLEPAIRSELLNYVSPDAIARIINSLESGDTLSFIEDLTFEQQTDVVRFLSKKEQAFLNEALSYDEGTAGRLMQRELVAVPRFWTVSQVKRYIKTADFLPDQIFNVYVIDANHRPLGYISLSELLKHDEDEKISHFMQKDVFSFSIETLQKEVAFYFRHYGLASAPVLDSNGRIKGDITLNNVVNLIDEEAERAFLGLAGAANSDIHMSLLKASTNRFKWVMITAFSSILSSYIISKFDKSIEQIVALAVLMSIVVAIGGSVSLQVASVTIRALSNGEFRLVRIWYNLWKEVQVGFINGVLISSILVIMVLLWYGDLSLALVFGVTILINVIYGSVMGLSIPVVLFRFNYDPAISAPPFLIPACDMMGYGSFLYLATLYLI
ncbi:MAG: magnesium transporter [Alphaproteobacteria bacterium]|nr:magnesium transporter [Alphaproteobacteria bacterium]